MCQSGLREASLVLEQKQKRDGKSIPLFKTNEKTAVKILFLMTPSMNERGLQSTTEVKKNFFFNPFSIRNSSPMNADA